jgi:hypothetical protein
MKSLKFMLHSDNSKHELTLQKAGKSKFLKPIIFLFIVVSTIIMYSCVALIPVPGVEEQGEHHGHGGGEGHMHSEHHGYDEHRD